jgi:hypothetical protein
MGFASAWLNQRALFPELIKETPDCHTGIIVVIPAFDEPSIIPLLNSLNSCTAPECRTEVLIIINAPENASDESIRKNKSSFFRLYAIDAGRSPKKGWGVGLARKAGMDEAVRRFNIIDKPEGVIVCLDADCTVERNYFTSISSQLLYKKDRSACSIYFEHPLSDFEFKDRIYNYIIQYELHLRYFIRGLIYTGYPYAFHTVGSTLAVKAKSYVKAGGMNRRRAGEDFYFVLKLIPQGGYFSLNATTVYPSPRESIRVPFGTGVMMTKLTGKSEGRLMTYNTLAFAELKDLFKIASGLYYSGETEILTACESLPPGIKSFINIDEWSAKIKEIKCNTSSYESFMKRFFVWFNTFKIVKYMNFVHADIFKKSPVIDSAYDLLNISGLEFSSKDPEKLLLYYRLLDKGVTE